MNWKSRTASDFVLLLPNIMTVSVMAKARNANNTIIADSVNSNTDIFFSKSGYGEPIYIPADKYTKIGEARCDVASAVNVEHP